MAEPPLLEDRIHAVGYRGHTLRGRPRRAPWPMARTALVLAWRNRSTKFALLMCLAVVGVAGVALVGQLLFQRFTSGSGLPMDPASVVGSAQEVFAGFVRAQFYTSAIAIAVIAGGCVAEDRAAGALELYFARPVSRLDYALGKLLGAGLVPTATLVAPTLLLWLVAVGISPPALGAQLWWLGVPALTAAALGAFVLTTTLVGASALGQKSRTVSVGFVATMLVLTGVGEGLVEAGQSWAGYLVPERDLRTVVDALLEVGRPSIAAQLVPNRGVLPNEDVAASLLGLLVFAAAGLGALAWRLRQDVES